MKKTDYDTAEKEIAEQHRTRALAHVGRKIAPGLVFYGIKILPYDPTFKPQPENHGVIRAEYDVQPTAEDGNDSIEAFLDADGIEASFNFLEDIGNLDGNVNYTRRSKEQ